MVNGTKGSCRAVADSNMAATGQEMGGGGGKVWTMSHPPPDGAVTHL
jgi:hypothetical protein